MRSLKEIEKDYLTVLNDNPTKDRNTRLEKLLDELREDHGAFCDIACGSKVIDNPAANLYRQISKNLPV